MDIRLLIVDDHPSVREALRFVFTAAGVRQCVEAATCAQAIRFVRELPLDAALLDIELPDGNGLNVLAEVQAGGVPFPVVIHSYHDSPRLLWRSFHLGASGYVVKGLDKNALIRAVRQAAAGASVWTAEQMAQIREMDSEFAEFDPAELAAI